MRGRDQKPEQKNADNVPAETTPEKKPPPVVDVTPAPGPVGVDGRPLNSKPIEYVPDTTIPDPKDVNIPRGVVDWKDLGKVNAVSKQVALAVGQYDPRHDNDNVRPYLSGAAATLWDQLDGNVGDYQNRPVPVAHLISMNAAEEDGQRVVYVTTKVKTGTNTSAQLIALTFAPQKSVVMKIAIEDAY